MKNVCRIACLGVVAVLSGCGQPAPEAGCAKFGELQIPRRQLLEPGRFPLIPTQGADQSDSGIAISLDLHTSMLHKRLFLSLTHRGAIKGPGYDPDAIKEFAAAGPAAVEPDIDGLYRFYQDKDRYYWYLVRSARPEEPHSGTWVVADCSTVGGSPHCLYGGFWREIYYSVSLDYSAIAKLGEVTAEIESNFERWQQCETPAKQ